MLINGLLVAVYASAALCCLLLSRRWFGSALAPFGLYATVWCLSLGLYSSDIIEYDAIGADTVAILLFCTTAFLVGAWLAGLIYRGWISRSATKRELPTVSLRHPARLVTIAFGLFCVAAVGVLLYYRLLEEVVGLSTLWTNPQRIRYEESYGVLRRLGWISFLHGLMVPTFVLSVMCIRLSSGRIRIAGVMLAIGSLIAMAPSSGRTVMFNIVIWGGLASVYCNVQNKNPGAPRGKLAWLRVAIPLAVVALSYFVITQSLLKKQITMRNYAFGTVLEGPFEGLIDPYHYVVSPIVGFGVMLRNPGMFAGNGNLTFGAIARVLHEFAPEEFLYPDYVQPFVFTPLPGNVYTYLDAFFLDFGYIGLFVFPFLYGAGATFVYLSSQYRPSVFRIYLAGLMSLCTVGSIEVNRFGTLETWLWILIGFAVIKISGADRLRTNNVLRAEIPKREIPDGLVA